MPRAPEFNPDRRSYLGSHSAAAIIAGEALDAYGTATEIYSRMVGELGPLEETDAMRWGNRMERMILQDACERHGVEFSKCLYPCPTYFHPQFDFIGATPDLAQPCGKIGRDAKAVMSGTKAMECGPDGSAQMPKAWLMQGVLMCAVTGFKEYWFDAVLFCWGGQPRSLCYTRDVELEVKVLQRLVQWHSEHVVRREPPPVDYVETKVIHEILANRYPDRVKAPRDATKEEVDLAYACALARKEKNEAEKAATDAANKLKVALGPNTLLLDGGKPMATFNGKTLTFDKTWKAGLGLAEDKD